MRFDVHRRILWAWLAVAAVAALGTAVVLAQPGVVASPDTAATSDDPEEGEADAVQAQEETPAEDAPSNDGSDESAASMADDEAAESTEDPQATNAPAQLPRGHVRPVPLKSTESPSEESQTGSNDAASLKGVQPGQTTRAALHAQWGAPAQVETIAGGIRETFDVEPLGRVRVTIVKDVVDSLGIRLEKPMAIETIVNRLELTDVEPVEVWDEQGQLLGQAYPERGVMFGFAPRSDPPKVLQIIVEPIDAPPFLARAESRMATRYADCIADLKQALELAPDNGRAQWLGAQVALCAGELEQALLSARKAIELEPKEFEYRVTLAKILAEAGDCPQALEIVRDVIESGKAPKIVVARASCMWGDLLAASHERDYPQAIKYHLQAIKMAVPLAGDPAMTVRREAKELLVDAHLAVAHDIGWGAWQQKLKVVPKWIERASAFADDAIANEQSSPEIRLRVSEQALAALAGIADPPDSHVWIQGVTELGKKMVDEARDPAYQAQLAWHVGVALNEAVEIEASRQKADRALALGKMALDYLDQGEQAGTQLPNHDYVRGRLCYRLGAILAIEQADHKQAIAWFDRAVPLLESPLPAATTDCGKQGETFVSMAVSYWEEKNHREALRLTNQGVALMERAARDGLLSKTALAVPYGNLASMHEQMGNTQEAQKCSELAARYDETTTK
jgi:tetratricopeptide (TPR) repeat protein